MAWEKVKKNKGAGGIDGQSIDDYEENAQENIARLMNELQEKSYVPLPVRRVYIEKRGNTQEKRPLGIPAIHDRVCQQALKNRLEPILEACFNDCSYGYRSGKSTKDALGVIWKNIQDGDEWILDADLRDYFGTVNHELLVELIARKISDGRVLKLIKDMLEAGYIEQGKLFPTDKGTPQGGLCGARHNIYLHIRRKHLPIACKHYAQRVGQRDGTERAELCKVCRRCDYHGWK